MRSHTLHTPPHCHPSSPQTVVQCQRRPAQPLQNPSLSCCTILCSHTLTRHTTASPSRTSSQHAALLLRGYVQHLQKKKSKQTAHAEILPKTKACLHQSHPPAPLLGCSSTLPLPFTGSLARAVPRQAHTGTQTNITHNTTNNGIQEERRLSARRMTP